MGISLKIPKKDNIKSKLEIPIELKVIKNNETYFLVRNYIKQRIKFIEYCLKFRLSYEEIGNLLGITKQRVYALIRYGNNRSSGLTGGEKRSVRERDNNKCKICNSKKKLEIHHIVNPKNQSQKNLVTLCIKCHRKLDAIKRMSK